jgi:hypothetical protein
MGKLSFPITASIFMNAVCPKRRYNGFTWQQRTAYLGSQLQEIGMGKCSQVPPANRQANALRTSDPWFNPGWMHHPGHMYVFFQLFTLAGTFSPHPHPQHRTEALLRVPWHFEGLVRIHGNKGVIEKYRDGQN